MKNDLSNFTAFLLCATLLVWGGLGMIYIHHYSEKFTEATEAAYDKGIADTFNCLNIASQYDRENFQNNVNLCVAKMRELQRGG